MKQTLIRALSGLGLAALTATAAADSLLFESTAGMFGTDSAYTGSIDVTGSTLTITFNPTGSSGYLTSIAFNAPGGAITGLTTAPPKFRQLGALTAGPYGSFTNGAAVGSTWHSSGLATNGVAVGGSATFVYALSGGGFSASDFFSDTCGAPKLGCNPMVVRFRGLDGDLSDKVPAAIVPEPATYALLLMGIVTVVGVAARRARS